MTVMLNPAVLEEARWLDGPLTERDLEDLAARKNLPLHIERPRPVYVAIPKRRPDVAELGALLKAERLRASDLTRQAEDAWRRANEVEAKLRALMAEGEDGA